ncbi:MAG: hypothetical protein HY928_16930 [Elusimicrobia bacterium]|nr:hypothetical protein [Elusimicrobiota bacterium]
MDPLRAPAHLEEFAELVTTLRAKALDPARRDAPVDPGAEARAGRSSAGLRVMYTARLDAGGPEPVRVHHLSLSMVGGLGPEAAPTPGPFALLALKLLRGLPHADGMYRSENGVFHAEWTVPPEGEEAYAAAPPPIVPAVRLAALLSAYDAAAQRAFARVQTTGISPGTLN